MRAFEKLDQGQESEGTSGDTGARRNILMAGGSLLLILQLERSAPARVYNCRLAPRSPSPLAGGILKQGLSSPRQPFFFWVFE